MNSSNGLVPNQIYRFVIVAENSVGSTLSEELLLCKFVYNNDTCLYLTTDVIVKLKTVYFCIYSIMRTHAITIPTDTTGLQSSTAVVELNGSITVTCTFATGASSTGCQVTILIMDNLRELISKNLSRHIEVDWV